MQLEYLLIGGISMLAGFIIGTTFTIRNMYLTIKRIESQIQVAEEELNQEIIHIGYNELVQTPAGRQLMGLMELKEPNVATDVPVAATDDLGQVLHAEVNTNSVVNDDEAKLKIVEEFNKTLGRLSEEASSELVQQELEAMSKAVTKNSEVTARKSTLASSLFEIAEEFANIDAGKDITQDGLEEVLSRIPKSNPFRSALEQEIKKGAK